MAEANTRDEGGLNKTETNVDNAEEEPSSKPVTNNGSAGKKTGFLSFLSNWLWDGPPTNSRQPSQTMPSQMSGLPNIGNTCYMNAVLQCLRSVKELKELLSYESHFHFLSEFTMMMKGIQDEKKKRSNLAYLKEATQFDRLHQQDVHEYLTAILEKLHGALTHLYRDQASCDVKKCAPKEHVTSIVSDTFEGQFESHLKCEVCKKELNRFDPFTSISVPLQHSTEEGHLCSYIEHFMSKEKIENWLCPGCSETVTVERSVSISKGPRILVIHLKRFYQDEDGNRHKISTLVEYPEELDISKYCQPANSSELSCTYELFGVIHHFGTIKGGHYIACCKNYGNGQWHKYNDERVTTCSQDDIHGPSAYVLFYCARDKVPSEGIRDVVGPDQCLQITQLKAELEEKDRCIEELKKLLTEKEKEIQMLMLRN